MKQAVHPYQVLHLKAHKVQRHLQIRLNKRLGQDHGTYNRNNKSKSLDNSHQGSNPKSKNQKHKITQVAKEKAVE